MDCTINFSAGTNTDGIQWELQILEGSEFVSYDASGEVASPDLSASITLPEDYDPSTQCYKLRWRRRCADDSFAEWSSKQYGNCGDSPEPPAYTTAQFLDISGDSGASYITKIIIDSNDYDYYQEYDFEVAAPKPQYFTVPYGMNTITVTYYTTSLSGLGFTVRDQSMTGPPIGPGTHCQYKTEAENGNSNIYTFICNDFYVDKPRDNYSADGWLFVNSPIIKPPCYP